MNSSKPPESQDPIPQLKKDAKHWHEQTPSEGHQQNTLQAIRDEFKMPRQSRNILSFPVFSSSLTAVAAILILGIGFLVYQSNQPEPQPQESTIALSAQQIEEELKVLSLLPQLPEQVAVSASLLEDPFIEELNAILEEMEATLQGLLELVEAS